MTENKLEYLLMNQPGKDDTVKKKHVDHALLANSIFHRSGS
jgi:hypothetical protein